MAISVARLRVGLVVGVVLLAVVVGGFLGYARYRTHRFLAGLPGKLGIDIRRETNGYTYSQSVGGKTVMTLHAAKAVERTDGKIVLHDVSMVLYGRKQDRADRISGAEFEYDQAAGVVRAVGEVHIDLQAPAAAERGRAAAATSFAASHADEADPDGGRMLHVKTSGLVYLQKLGVAATDQELEFRFGQMTGHAKGAEYNSDTGVVILQSAVKANGLQHGTPVLLTAAHAELDRQTELALLTEARYSSPGETARGDQATVHLRGDGSPERIEATGNVVLSRSDGGTVTAPHADVLLNAAGQAQAAHLFGGVSYVETTSLREGRGEAQDGRVAFDATGRAENVILAGSVHTHERVRAAQGSAWSERDAVAGRMVFALTGQAGGQQRVLRQAEVTSGARLTLVSDAGLAASTRSELSGDRLVGDFVEAGKTTLLSTVHGSGHTVLRRAGPQGAEQTSAGDTLELILRAAKRSARGPGGPEEIDRAVQTGHVTLTGRAAARPGAPLPTLEKATAQLAVYDGDADHLTLTGHAQVVDDQGTVSAARIVLEHAGGDAAADGTVKATYLQANAAEPVHVLADHATLQHDAGRAIFYGSGSRAARLWQGASQVEAPVLDLEQDQGRLTARGDPSQSAAGTGYAPVHAVLAGEGRVSPAGNDPKKDQPVRIAARAMVYLDASRQVDFTGGVKVEDADGTLRAEQATAYLQAAPSEGSSAPKRTSPASNGEAGGFFGGSIDRIVAQGKIQIEQPGRHADGSRLVYTAADGLFVLTGTPAAPPRLVDEAQGTVTGQSLRFHSGDRSVMVVGGDAKTAGQRVHTVTRVKQQ